MYKNALYAVCRWKNEEIDNQIQYGELIQSNYIYGILVVQRSAQNGKNPEL